MAFSVGLQEMAPDRIPVKRIFRLARDFFLCQSRPMIYSAFELAVSAFLMILGAGLGISAVFFILMAGFAWVGRLWTDE